MNLNIARTICGIATEFDVPCQNDGRSWSAAQFREFIDLEIGIPLRVDHGPLINSRGVIMNVGVVRGVAEISNTVNGLLILAEIDHAEGYGDSLLHDIRSILSQTWLPAVWGLSIAAHVTEDTVLPYEISLTKRPAYENAKVLGVGEEALDTWNLLTEMPRRIITGRC